MKQLLWKYLIGPIVADAKNTSELAWQGVTAYPGYNLINTAVYALIAVTLLYMSYRFFQRKKIEFNSQTALYSLPFILLGGVLRFLEDAQAVTYPYNIVLITPFVYLLIAAFYIPAISFLKNNRRLFGFGGLIFAPSLVFALTLFPEFRILYAAGSIALAAALTGLFSWFITDEYDSLPFRALAGSQFFGGSVAALASFYSYVPKQLLTQTFYNLMGPLGILVLKTGIVVAALSVIKDIEEDGLKALALITLYSIGFGTGLRVLLRVTAGI